MVTSADGQQSTADQMERHLFKQLLQMGARLMQLYFDLRSQASARKEVINQEGARLPYHSEKKRGYYSIFGELEISRPYFYRKGTGGCTPLDAELGLGEDSYSDFLRELHEELGVYLPFGQDVAIMGRLLEIELSKRCTQQFVETDAADAAAYYEQKPAPPVEEERSILVIQADGKGIPIVKTSAKKDKVRLKRGEARRKKKAVTATALYTIQPAPRTVAEVVASLLEEGQEPPHQPLQTTAQTALGNAFWQGGCFGPFAR
jgi:hypothetical protein